MYARRGPEPGEAADDDASGLRGHETFAVAWRRHIVTGWRAAVEVPVEEVPLDAISEIDEDCWFNGRPATVRAVVDHVRQIENANVSVPVILSCDGQVLGGMHRIARAFLVGGPPCPRSACRPTRTRTGSCRITAGVSQFAVTQLAVK